MTDAEQSIAGIVREVLGLESVGLDDNFFEIGGTSALLVEVHGRLCRRFDREIAIAELFDHPTIRDLARYLAPQPASRAGAPGEEPAKPKPVDHREGRVSAGRDRLKRRRNRGKD